MTARSLTDGLAQAVIDALPEPAFLLSVEGRVLAANRAARGLLGGDAGSGHLAERLVTAAAELSPYLERARKTSSPLPGALTFRTGAGEARLRVHCCRLSLGPGEVVLMLRCVDPREDRFTILAVRVRQLDAELRRRVREKALLAEALNQNRTLMRELQHRVKNNIQMMMSLLSMSAANLASDDLRRFVAAAKDRFRALATTQDLIYEAHSEAQSDAEISARELFGRLARSIEESTEDGVSVETDIADVWLPQESAHCLALIANELITNSVKHGMQRQSGEVRLELAQSDGQLRLVVSDGGRGYPPLDALPRTSGLTLIRGLCRQIGASLELGNDPVNGGGARSVVTFSDARADRMPAQAAGSPIGKSSA
jgi:two-component sensor histidine kinase